MTPDTPPERGGRAGARRRPGRRLLFGRRAQSGPTSRLRRRVGAAVRLTLALILAGGVYAVFAPGMSAAEEGTELSAAAREGRAIYELTCITCHGPNAQGVEGRGPSLIGTGSAAVEFQVTSGRMPLARQEAQGERKPPKYTDDQARQLGQYIQELGGGPQLPAGTDLSSGGDVARGGDLFRMNCSACHNFTGGGGALSSGKYAPPLDPATDRQIYAAMLTGPQNMPVFGDNQLSPQEKMDIIAYVQNLKEDKDPGGWGLGRFGPVTEGLAIFLVGIVALVFATLWIAGKS